MSSEQNKVEYKHWEQKSCCVNCSFKFTGKNLNNQYVNKVSGRISSLEMFLYCSTDLKRSEERLRFYLLFCNGNSFLSNVMKTDYSSLTAYLTKPGVLFCYTETNVLSWTFLKIHDRSALWYLKMWCCRFCQPEIIGKKRVEISCVIVCKTNSAGNILRTWMQMLEHIASVWCRY